eukprot:EG_transcript_15466
MQIRRKLVSSLNIGQALHILKSEHLKVREEHPRELVVEAVQAVMKGAGTSIVFNFAQGVLDAMGFIYVARLGRFVPGKPPELKITQVQRLEELPDIGALMGAVKEFAGALACPAA